jgi:SAM-dependent methyltransferase
MKVVAASLLYVLWAGPARPSDPPAAAPAPAAAPKKKPDIHYIPTPPEVVDRMLELAGVKAGDVVYDLGCGDGRIVIAAARKYGVKCLGVDIDPERIREANENARKAGVTHLVTFREDDIFEMDLTEATVVTTYLSESVFTRLIPRLETLKPGTRIVAHDYAGPIKPNRVVRFTPTASLTPEEFREFRLRYKERPSTLVFLKKLEAIREHTVFLFVAPVERVKEEER